MPRHLLECGRTKKPDFESAESLHNNWLAYSIKYDINKDIEPLYPLLNDPSAFTRTETQVLDALYNATLLVLESTPHIDPEQKTRALYFQYNLCSCDACKKECAAHINKKGQIRISQKVFQNKLKSPPPAGLLEIMYILLHEMMHGIFPELDEEPIIEKTEQTWKSGMFELAKEKLNKN
ncbi:MAG: hypothetical protein NWF06_01075 [Candidatus Bathyarchaeota archaeon]|nr:hypothetical protein [Candidatus Bathyarchaeum sp.]